MFQEENQPAKKETVICSVTIPALYAGPPKIANGGYVCGLVAKFIDGAADVMIRLPTPLDHEMQIVSQGDESFYLMDGDKIIVQAKPGFLDLDVPDAPGFDDAVEAAKTSIALKDSPHPGMKARGIHPICFCCGADVPGGEGLKIHPGRLEGANILAAPWTPTPELGDDEGNVRPEFVWTALDCPGAFALMELTNTRPGLSARLIGRLDIPLRVGEPCVIASWPVAVDGRKLFAGTAVFNANGQIAGRTLATWINRPPIN
jgi:hypothetical protein